MRIYLDCCCLQRPLDDQSQARVKLESEAILAILAAAADGQLTLVGSRSLEIEVGRIPDESRRDAGMEILQLCQEWIPISPEVEEFSLKLESEGIASMDSMHLSLASHSGVDYFGTCDDRLLRKCSRRTDLNCRVADPIRLAADVLR